MRACRCSDINEPTVLRPLKAHVSPEPWSNRKEKQARAWAASGPAFSRRSRAIWVAALTSWMHPPSSGAWRSKEPASEQDACRLVPFGLQ